jgi:hypothetical protein
VADYSTQLLASSRIVLLGSNMHNTRGVRTVCILLVCHMHMNLCMYLVHE